MKIKKMSDIAKIQRLREETGAGIMECKKVLEEAGGDFDKAVQLIKEKGYLGSSKVKEKEAKAGLIEAYVHQGRIGVILDLRAETDFVVNSEPFRKLAHELAMQIAASSPKDIKELLAQPYIRDETLSVRDLINEVISKVGENIQIKAFHRLEV